MNEDALSEFRSITGAPSHVAQGFLQMTGDDVMQAVQLYYDNPELQSSFSELATGPSASSGVSGAGPRASGAGFSASISPRSRSRQRTTTSRRTGTGDGRGSFPYASSSSRHHRAAGAGSSRSNPLPVDSDDDMMMGDGDDHQPVYEQIDEDEDIVIPDSDEDDTVAQVERVARTAQEEEDAALAQRMQEELYRETGGGGTDGGGGLGGFVDEDGVRAPMARTTETLIGPDTVGPSIGLGRGGPSAWGTLGSHSPFFSDHSEVLRQLQHGRRGPPNPFSQSIWEDDTDGPPQIPPLSELGVESGVTGSRARRLQDLFRPPYELISNASFEDAREEGKAEKKWLLINLQDMSDFTCQSLNRDHWKDESIRALIREHFIFLQYDKDRLHSRQYTHLYFTNHEHENPDNYPHVAIVDPRTGEQVKVWSGRPFPSPAELHADLLEFLDRYSLESFSKNPVVRSRPRNVPVNVDRLSEEEQLRLAVEASLAGVDGGAGGSGAGSSGASSSRNVYDPDAFTRSPTEMRHGGRARTGHIVDLTGELEDSGPVTPAADDALTAHGALPAPPQPAEPAAAPSPFAAIPSDRPHTEPSSDPATTTRIQFRHPNGRVIRRFKLDDPVRRIYEWLKAEPLEGKEGVEFELKTSPQGTDLIESLDKTIAEAGLKQGTVMIEFL